MSRTSRKKPRLLTPEKAAHWLGVSTMTLRRWEIEGIVHPYLTPKGQRRYAAQEIEQLYAHPTPEEIEGP